MRRSIPVLAILIAVAVLGAQPTSAAEGAVDPRKLTVEFAKGAVIVNGTELSIPFQRKELIQVLGNPDRESKLTNTILTWDELGIHAYQKPDSEEIHALQLTMDREEFAFSPKKLFTGTVKVEGLRITAASTIESINHAIAPAVFAKTLSLDWRLEYSASALYLMVADAKTKSKNAVFSSVQLAKKVGN